MPGLNLTREEARERAELVDVTGYDVHLDLREAPLGAKTFRSRTTVRLHAGGADAPVDTWLDLVAAAVHEVRVDGTELDPATVVADHRVALRGLSGEVKVSVDADCRYMSSGEGLHRFVDPVDSLTYCYSQFEVADARRVFATFEQPDLKATFAFTVDAPADWTVVSNEPVAERLDLPDGGVRWVFGPTPRLSTYVTAICAGPYYAAHDVYQRHGGGQIPLGLFCRQSLTQHLDAAALFEVTKQGFAFFEDVFGLAYPFTTYDQLFVPEFNAGAMENAGCVTFRDEYLFRSRVTDAAYERRAETVLHEMAHMWFGDLVTMRWWDDLWLNESFATWASILAQSEATRWTQAWTTFATAEKLWALRQDQLPSTHPISADITDLEDVEVNFDGITYAKGASVLKQLVAWVGREEFLAGVRDYFADHAWGNTTLPDFFAALEHRSGRDLSRWGELWLRQAGVNVLRPVVRIGDDGTYEEVSVLQEAPSEHPVLRPHRLAVGLYDVQDGALRRRHRVELDVDGDTTEVSALRGVPAADLLLLNDDDLTFARIRLDDASLATARRHIAAFGSSLPRALVWTAATDMLRSAELPATQYVELLLTGLAAESDLMVVQTLLASGRGAVELYSAPARREALRATWADGLAELAGSAPAGSDHQLAFVRAWVSAAHTQEHLETVAALLAAEAGGNGAAPFPGLTVDADLRWHLLQRLVATGQAGESAITAELERDPTATGHNEATKARAARPDATSKEETWTALLAEDGLGNRDAESALAGFGLPEHAEVLAGFVDRYFDEVPQVWTTRTIKTAERLVHGLFPRVIVSPEVAGRAWAAAQEHADRPALARLLREGAADVERALAAQACDAAG